MEIFYLEHSGFAVETDRQILIFDYYRDAAGVVPKLLTKGKPVQFFCSHNHGDHFYPGIGKWHKQVEHYYLSFDITAAGGLTGVAPDQIISLQPYEIKRSDELIVKAYGSTDAGISFAVTVDGQQIFHAGDFNWWHWKGDTPENIRQAEVDFRREMKQIAGEKFDVAFFPVDSRLEDCRTRGVEEFCRQTEVGRLIPMHAFGEPWPLSGPFVIGGRTIPVWVPVKPGQTLQL